jgi:hypothetical protein
MRLPHLYYDKMTDRGNFFGEPFIDFKPPDQIHD